ncbi:hypothetical protein NMY22_g6303 [Coprinellus aureogranulatus]|nr:hypothetical protein NMY22_g6303 [Coprinellus aureogranulatus]
MSCASSFSKAQRNEIQVNRSIVEDEYTTPRMISCSETAMASLTRLLDCANWPKPFDNLANSDVIAHLDVVCGAKARCVPIVDSNLALYREQRQPRPFGFQISTVMPLASSTRPTGMKITGQATRSMIPSNPRVGWRCNGVLKPQTRRRWNVYPVEVRCVVGREDVFSNERYGRWGSGTEERYADAIVLVVPAKNLYDIDLALSLEFTVIPPTSSALPEYPTLRLRICVGSKHPRPVKGRVGRGEEWAPESNSKARSPAWRPARINGSTDRRRPPNRVSHNWTYDGTRAPVSTAA